MMKLSIIIPVYNVEKYIKSCLTSLYNQQLEEDKYELLIVNDGTPDKSMDVVNEYSRCHENIRVINQKNQGVSVARNTGIELAEGDFLIFVDPDDWISPNSLHLIYNYLVSHETTEILFLRSFFSSNKEERYVWQGILKENQYYSGEELYELGYMRGSVCGGVYKKNFIMSNNIKFPKGIRNGEDSIFVMLMSMSVKYAISLNLPFYFVYERENSASRSFTLEKIYGFRDNIEFLYTILCDIMDNGFKSDLIKFSLYAAISSAIGHYVNNGYKDYMKLYNELNLKRVLPIRINKSSSIGKQVWLLNHSYVSFCLLKRIQGLLHG